MLKYFEDALILLQSLLVLILITENQLRHIALRCTENPPTENPPQLGHLRTAVPLLASSLI